MSSAAAASVSDYAVRVNAVAQANPPIITLSWPADTNSFNFGLYRKSRDDTSWGPEIALAAEATSYADTNVATGRGFEYQIHRFTAAYDSYGYIYSGIEVPLVESRGKVILLVDSSFASVLTADLTRLQQDLVGDGWMVLRHDVARMAVEPADTSPSVWTARSNELASVKALITADYNTDPSNVKAVFIVGHIPVPYSGDLYPDGHNSHRGAWPADTFYGDIDGSWTDSSLTSNSGSDARNRNVPGDGKFDQTRIASDLELQVGRVDFANMPSFLQGEAALLRQYLTKDHNFRHRLVTAARRGLIDDELGLSTSEPLAANGWRDFAAFFGASNTLAADWLTTLSTQSYLWGYGCGAGTFTSCSGVASTADFTVSDPRVVFSMFFGSYFGDWDSPDNLLRASIATTNYSLTSAWVGRPFWFFHHMGLGETIGFSTRVSQNDNGTLYSGSGNRRFVSIALMGDPTLRMHVVAPSSALVAGTNPAGGVDLKWSPSADSVLGYHVYRAPTAAGPFVRLNSALLNATNYTDPVVTQCTYMVRAVKLEVTGSGSYYNASQGIFQDFHPAGAPQMLVISARSASKVYGEALAALTATYDGFVNGDTTNSLSSQAVLSTPATASSPVGAYPIQVSGAAGTNYAISFVDGALTILPAATTSLLTASTNPALPGQPITFTFTVDIVPPGTGTLTGTVQFKIDGTNAAVPMPVVAGVASLTNSVLGHGWHSVEAGYTGDSNFSVSPGSLSQAVNTPPEAGPDTVLREPTNGASLAIATLLTNDWDPDNDLIMFFGADAISACGGTVESDGETIAYTPAAGFVNTDTFNYTIMDTYGATAVGVVTVAVLDNGPPASLSISNGGSGTYIISGSNIAGRTNRILYVEDLDSTNWRSLGTAVANPSGIFQFRETNASAQRFYRSVYP